MHIIVKIYALLVIQRFLKTVFDWGGYSFWKRLMFMEHKNKNSIVWLGFLPRVFLRSLVRFYATLKSNHNRQTRSQRGRLTKCCPLQYMSQVPKMLLTRIQGKRKEVAEITVKHNDLSSALNMSSLMKTNTTALQLVGMQQNVEPLCRLYPSERCVWNFMEADCAVPTDTAIKDCDILEVLCLFIG